MSILLQVLLFYYLIHLFYLNFGRQGLNFDFITLLMNFDFTHNYNCIRIKNQTVNLKDLRDIYYARAFDIIKIYAN